MEEEQKAVEKKYADEDLKKKKKQTKNKKQKTVEGMAKVGNMDVQREISWGKYSNNSCEISCVQASRLHQEAGTSLVLGPRTKISSRE